VLIFAAVKDSQTFLGALLALLILSAIFLIVERMADAAEIASSP
jgi:hypothetical protein